MVAPPAIVFEPLPIADHFQPVIGVLPTTTGSSIDAFSANRTLARASQWTNAKLDIEAKWTLATVGLLEAICAISFNCIVIIGEL